MDKIGSPESANYQQDCISLHNRYREILGLQPLRFSQEAANVAERWATYLSNSGEFEHSHTAGFGENLYWVSGGSSECAKAVNAWFEEYKFYNGGKIGEGDFGAYGHFTQLIWPETTEVGCARVTVGPVSNVVCEYRPPGNFVGQRLDVKIRGTKFF
jgi:hypothetical protein